MVEELTLEISDGHYMLLEELREEMDEDVNSELASVVESCIHNSYQEYLR